MANFNIPASPPTYEIKLSEFLGVDFSSSFSEIDKRRSPNGYNFINNNGTIEKRNGYKIITCLGESVNINGIWNVDSVNGECFVVHCGNKLYEMDKNFDNYTEIMSGLSNKRSKGTVINSKLLILDGLRAVVYDLLKENNKVSYLDEIGYIPTTQIARSPNGLASQMYEQVNLLQDSRINLFTSTETDTIYQLDATNISEVEKVEVLNNSAEWIEKTEGTDYTVNTVLGQVIFNTAIGLPVVDDRDNVRIKYKAVSSANKSQVNKCSIMSVYGYAGANNRIFLSGNPDCPNIVMYSHIENITYIPVENVIKLGLEIVPINGLAKTNDGKLAALKPKSDTDSTIFYLGYGTYNGIETFPLEGSTKGEGNISQFAHDVLVNEPLILSDNGIFALNTVSITDERYVYHRSYYIDNKLKLEPNLSEAIGIVNNGKYYLAINNHVYVADSRFKSGNPNSKYSNYQYEWYYWTNIPVRIWFVWNNELYFGDKYGNICKFRNDNEGNRFKDGQKNVEAEWDSTILDLNSQTRKKNIRRVSISSNSVDSELTIGYRLKKGDKEVLTKINTDFSFLVPSDTLTPSNSLVPLGDYYSYPKTTMIRKKAKKLSFFSLYIENKGNRNMSFDSICIVYTIGSYYKGD